MTRVWSNGNTAHPEETVNETDFNIKEEGKILQENGQHASKMNGNHPDEEQESEEDEERGKKSFFGICFSEDLEKELAEQSKLALKMIYFFQVLPFYVLQFTSGMALGNNI